jgi:hypothetical protein
MLANSRMNALYQRLRELDPKSFEQLCFQLLRERHPGASLRGVHGASGDQGADMFQGDLDDGPTIWQCKAFPDGIKKSQKQQIRHSLKTAAKNFAPRRWILCLSVDMDIRAHRWFQKLARSYAERTVAIGLMQAGDIVNELAHRKVLRDAFFPGATLEVAALRALVTRTADLSDMQQAALSQENAEQLIERLKARDARFNYEVSISPDRPAEAARSGACFSVSVGSTCMNAFARDIEALRLDPPKMQLKLKGAGVAKFLEFQRTGRSQTFVEAEISEITSTLPMFGMFGFERANSLRLKQSASLRERIVPVRLVFGAGQDPVVYDYVPFRTERVGTDEMQIVSDWVGPFRLRLILGAQRGTFTFSERFLDFSVSEADKYIRASGKLAGGRFEMYSLASGKANLLWRDEGRDSRHSAAGARGVLCGNGTDLRVFRCRLAREPRRDRAGCERIGPAQRRHVGANGLNTAHSHYARQERE